MVGGTSKQTGLWKVGNCHSKRAFICKKNVGKKKNDTIHKSDLQNFYYHNNLIIPFLPVNTDSQIPVPPTTVSTKSFYKLGNESYKLVAQKMNWDEARRQCQADDADLASILNPYSQAHITLQISKYNEPVWIGLNSNVVKAQPVTVWLNVFSSVKNAQ